MNNYSKKLHWQELLVKTLEKINLELRFWLQNFQTPLVFVTRKHC